MTALLLATQHGLIVCERAGDAWREAGRGLVGRNVTSVIGREGVILAGTTEGVWRSDDSGQTWNEASDGITSLHIRWMANHPDVSDLEFAGSEPAGIFVSHDGGGSWRPCPEVTALRDKYKWSLPYSPEAGCVRGFAFLGTRGYAAVEVGGVLRSDDNGDTWQLVEGSSGNPELDDAPEPMVHADVHSISVHAWSRDTIIAPTGGGLYRSTDGGKTWACIYECYCRAAWMDPEDPQHIVFGPADGVDRDSRIEATNDGGLTWRPASGGLDVPWRKGMLERLVQVGDELLAVRSNGELISGPLSATDWQRVLPSLPGVTAVCRFGS